MCKLYISLIIGFVSCSVGVKFEYKTVTAGEDVNLQCMHTNLTYGMHIQLTRSYDSKILLNYIKCTQCDGDTSVIGSYLTIRNVSLADESEYDLRVIYRRDIAACKTILTVNVPAKGLTLVEHTYDQDYKINPKGGSIVVGDGENKTLVCKTNTSVKPHVDLEWVIPEEMDMLWYIVRPLKLLNDSKDPRLTLPTLTIDFSPTYMDDDDGEIELLCVVKNSSQINASVIIKKKEFTTVGNSSVTSLLHSHSSTAKCGQSEDWKPVHTVIVVGCLSFVLLIISVCGIIGYRKRIGNADGVSMTTKQKKDSNQEPAHTDFTMSDSGVGGDPAVSRSDVVSRQPIQDSHDYMEMKPISLPRISSNLETSKLGNSSSLNPRQSACDSSLQAWQRGSTLDIILKSCDVGYVSCNSGPATFPQQGIALESPDSVITTYL